MVSLPTPIRKSLSAPSIFIFAVIMALLFPAVMYTDDYYFLGLSHLGSLFQSTWALSQTNSPVYSVYALFWVISSIFISQPIWIYLACMSFFVWIVFTTTIARISKSLNFQSPVLFVALFMALFFLDRQSNQNIFWSVGAINSFVQHFIPVLVLTNWFIFRNIDKRFRTIITDAIVIIILFGFPGEILITTLFCTAILYVQSRSENFHLIPLFGFGLVMVYLNLYSQGAKNRTSLLSRPESLTQVIDRCNTYFSFLIKDSLQILFISFFAALGLGLLLKFTPVFTIQNRIFLLLSALVISLCGVSVSAYQSIYHFIGINFLLQLLAILLALKIAHFIKFHSKLNFRLNVVSRFSLIVIFVSFGLLISISATSNLVILHGQSAAFSQYSTRVLSNSTHSEAISKFVFRDSSNIGVIGPNIPEWKSFGLVSLDFVESGIQEAIRVLQAKSTE